jgi:RNA polymerase sigma-70 factor (ECF subfamily)
MASATSVLHATELSDEELVRWVVSGDTSCFEVLMRRYNRRIYRAARAILRDDAEAEDVAQEAYVKAYQHLAQFEGRASFSTWLTRIAVNEALARVRKRSRNEEMDGMDETRKNRLPALSSHDADPEMSASNAEVRTLLEHSIDALPDSYRLVFVLRDVDELSTEETADCLGITRENVKMRLHRARAQLRRELYARAGATSTSAFQFLGDRCDRIVLAVRQRIQQLPSPQMRAMTRN